MRTRSLTALSTVALAAALLAGCTGATDTRTIEEPPATLEPAPPVDLCAIAAPPGPASEAIAAEGPVGSPASVRFALPLNVSGTERSVLVEGPGEALDSASLVDYAMTAFDASTGEQVQTQGYDGVRMLPVPAVSVGQFLGCATVGSRVAVAMPPSDEGGATVWVLDVLEAQPSRAIGADQEPTEGMPTVELAEGGAPTVTIPGDPPPAETRVSVLKKGEGPTVAPGDTVMAHYSGVRWSDGSVFDSSWNKGAPTALVTSEVIAGYRLALEGQTVGSQVLGVIPPASGYGEGTINEVDLKGETLVFVVDILDAVPAA